MIWVDELIIAANYSGPVNDVNEMLSAKFKMKNLGRLENLADIQTLTLQREGRRY